MTNHTDKHTAFNIVNDWVNNGQIEDRMEYDAQMIMDMESCSNAIALICISHLGVIAMHGESKWLQMQITF